MRRREDDVDKQLESRIAKARIMAETGSSQQEIARELKVTTRTIRRWMNHELSEEVEEQLDEVSREHREKFMEDAWGVVHAATAVVKEKLDKSSASQAAIICGIYVDKVAKFLGQSTQISTATETLQIVIAPPKDMDTQMLREDAAAIVEDVALPPGCDSFEDEDEVEDTVDME